MHHKQWFPEEDEWIICNEEYFYVNTKNKKDGLNPSCKRCEIKSAYKRNKDNPERYKASWTKNNNQPYRKKVKTESARKHRAAGKYRLWQNKNRDKVNASSLKRRLTKKHNISKEQWEACKQYFNYECAYCGLSEKEHKKLYGEQLHKEHAVFNGSNKIDNCVTGCKPCNSSKGEYNLEEWYEQQEFFSEERLNKIHKWLNEDYKKFEQ